MVHTLDLNFLGHQDVIACGLLDGGRRGAALVDPGPTTTLAGLQAALGARGRSLSDIEAILVTHIHLDHAGGTGAIVRDHPGVTVYVHERGATHLADPSRLMQSATRLYGEQMERLWGEMVPVPAERLHVLRGGERIAVAGRDVSVEYTPGHASHHVSYFDQETRTAFVGDTGGIRVGAWPLVLPPTPPPDIDLEAWRASLDVIEAWDARQVFVTHFGGFADPRAHLESLREWLGEVAALARAVLSDGTLAEDDRATAFSEALRRRIAERAGEEAAAACARAVSFGQCWQGLARYYRKKKA
jgi:glyoxylase-like metal-dependent hydrolase (beta-lactamase superfamily II)